MNLFFFVFIYQLYIKLSLEGELIPCESSNPIKTSQDNNKLNNIIYLLEEKKGINYNTFSYISDISTGNFFLQNEDYYYDKRTICQIDKYGQIIFNKTISSTTSFYGGKNIIIDKNSKKYIFSLNNFEANLIDINTFQIYSLTKHYNEEINSYENVLIKVNTSNSQQNCYLFGFVSQAEFLLYYYIFEDNTNLNPVIKTKPFKTIPFLKIVSCFQTYKNYIECLYINYKYETEVIVFDENLELLENIILNKNLSEIENNYFSKAILYKDEIGIYLYCYQYLEIKELIYDKYYGKFILTNYISNIITDNNNIISHNKYVNQMDLIRLKGNNFAIIEISESNNDIIYISIYTLYNNDKCLKVRIFEINLDIFDAKFNDILKSFNFNSYLGIGFSPKNSSSSCFIIFGYCNSTNIQNLFTINPNFELKPSEYININNNIFTDVLYGFKIVSLPEEITGIHLSSKLTKNKVFKRDILSKDDSLIFGFNKGNIINSQYSIEFVGITSQNPDLNIINENVIFSKYYGNHDLNSYYKPEKFLGKLIKFNFQFSNPINSFYCDLDYCGSCLYSYPNKCLTCLNGLNKLAENSNICYNTLPENNYYYDENKSMYMKCHINCNKCSQGPIYEENTYDDLVSTNCLECKNGYYEKEFNGFKNCLPNNCHKLFYVYNNIVKCVNSNDKCPEDYPFLNKLTNECLLSCGNLDSNICIDTLKEKLTFEQYLGEIRNIIKNGSIYRILNESDTSTFFFEEDNITYYVSMTNNPFNNISMSKIDLSNCENALKEIYDIDENRELLLLKIDISEPDILFPKIQYELYHPDSREMMNLSYCQNYTMDIEYEIEIDEDELFIYDPTSDYYNDICNTTTSESGTDISLNDRKEEFVHKNLSICDGNCKFVGYNSQTKQVKCECDILTEIKKNLGELKNMNFDDVLKGLGNSLNFKLMVCYKLFFSRDGFIKNIGSYILLGIILFFIGCLFYFFLKDIDNIKGIIDDILAYKRVKNFEKEEKFIAEVEERTRDKNKKKGIRVFKYILSSNNDNNKSEKSHNLSQDNMIKVNKRNIPFNKNKNEYKEIKIKGKDENKNLALVQKSDLLTFMKDGKSPRNKKNKNDEIDINKKNKNVKFRKKSIYELKKVDKSHKKYKLLKLNDYELNTLSYQFAIKLDERTLLQYYWSLLKRNQLIFFSFFPNVDYNSRSIKLFFFLHSFSFAFTINAVFFNDSTMHKIYIDRGQYYFVHRLPEKIIASLITTVLDVIIRILSLSERNIIKIKRESDINRAIILSNKIFKLLKIKFSIFFIFSFVLLIFFWYYLGCFCAVYKNTQLYLLKETCTSYLLSLLYPFCVYFLVALLRICSLRSENKNKSCLYNITKWIG